MRKLRLFIATALLTLSIGMTAFAGTWQAQENGQWKYQNDNGGYATGWIEDNGKSYYLDANGIMLANTVTPDGYNVGADGAWNGQPKQTAASNAAPTTGQKNALGKALEYLNFMPFSRTGLIEQLEYEGFSIEDATYAVDNCGADWNVQAVKSAQNYLNFMSFSRSGLIEQLEYEGFSTDVATYAVDICGVDWNAQAVLKAQEYVGFMSFSRSELIDQLEYEGFSHSQAEYAVSAIGY